MENISSLVQVMAWRWTGNQPLPKPMMTQLHNESISLIVAYRCHTATKICININSGNSLLPDGTKLVAWRHQAITWTNVDFSSHWWHSVNSPEGNFTSAHATILCNEFKNYTCTFEISATSPRGQWVNLPVCGMVLEMVFGSTLLLWKPVQ